MPRLPIVGVEAVVLGMAAFNANSRTVQAQVQQMSRSLHNLEVSSSRSTRSIASGFSAVSKAQQAAAAAAQRASAIQVRAGELAARVAITNQRATEAAAAARVRASLQIQAAAIQEQRAQLAIAAASNSVRNSVNASLQSRTAAMNQLTRANLQLQSAQLAQSRAAQQQALSISRSSATATQNAIRNAQVQAAAVHAGQAQQQAAIAATGVAAARAAAIAVAATIAVASAIAAVVAAMAAAESAAARYNQEVAFIGAISQASSADVAILSDKQLELSRRSTQSAGQLALASQELVKAGVDIKDVTSDVLEGVNNLVVASKGELEAARAATLVQVSVKGFGASAKEAADIATGAVQTSTLTFNEYSDAIRQGGGVLSATGVTLTQFGALVSTVGQTIKSGTEIGTGLRVMFQRLQAPSKEAEEQMKKFGISLYDTNGAARPVLDVVKDLNAAFGENATILPEATKQERDHAVAQIFGARSSKILNALLDEGTEGYLKQLDAVQRLKAADLAGEVLAPTAAQAKILRNQIEVLGIAFGQGLDPLVQHATHSLNEFLKANLRVDDVRNFGVMVGDFLYNAFANVSAAVMNTIHDFGKFYQALVQMEVAIRAFLNNVRQAIINFAQNLGAVVGKIVGDIAAIGVAASKGVSGLGELRSATQSFVDGIPSIGEAAGDAFEVLDTNIDRSLSMLRTAFGEIDFAAAGRGLISSFNPIAAALTRTGANWTNYAAQARAAIQSIADERDKRLEGATGPRGGVEQTDSETEPGFLPDTGELDKQAKKIADLLQDVGEVGRDFNDDLIKLADTTSEEIGKLYRRAFEDVIDAILENQRVVQEAIDEADAEFASLESNRVREAEREAERSILEQSIEEQRKLWERGAEDAAIVFSRQREDEERERALAREDLQRSLDFQREMQEKYIDDVLSAQERARNITRRNEDDLFAEAQDKRERDLKSELDSLEDKLKKEQQLREQALDDQLDAQQRALEASQELRERALRAELDAEKLRREHARDAAEIDKRELEARAEAQAEFEEEIRIGVKRSIAQSRLDAKLKEIASETGEDRKRLTEEQTEEQEDTAFDAGQQTRLDQLRAAFEAEDLAFEKEANAKKLQLEEEHQQQITDLESEHLRRRLELEDALKREQRTRDLQRAEEDRIFAEEQEATKRAFIGKLDAQERDRRRKEDEAEIARKRQEEDAERARKLKQDQAAELNRRTQEEKLRLLELKFEQEDHQLRIGNIHKQRDERIKSANKALEAQQESTQKQLARELVDLNENIDDKIRALRENYVDKLDDIARDGGAAIMPAVNAIMGTIATGLRTVRDTAAEAVTKLAEAFNAAEKLNIETSKRSEPADEFRTPSDWHADFNFAKGMGQSDDAARAYADAFQNKQYGGIVTGGRFGQAVPVMAHVGERFEGLGAYNSALTATRAAESMMRRGIGTASNVYNYNYNVDAHYGRVQPEGSVARDLSTLVRLTR